MKRTSILIGVGTILVASVTLAEPQAKSQARTFNNHAEKSSFCTDDGWISIVMSCEADHAHGSCAIGDTLLTGPTGTFHFGPGVRTIPKGCYEHSLANTTVVGNAVAYSTVWYHAKR